MCNMRHIFLYKKGENMKKILVTGGVGAIGSKLCEKLLDGNTEVFCMDNLMTSNIENIENLKKDKNFHLIIHDVCHPFDIFVNQIFHLSCPASPLHYQRNPIKTLETCVLGCMNVLKCAKDSGAIVLLASTSEIYGSPDSLNHPQKESYWGNVNTVGDRSIYDEGKRVSESFFYEYGKQGVDVRIARIFNTASEKLAFGDGRVVSNFVLQSLKNEPLTIFGDGSQTRSFMWVDDLIEGFIKLMASGYKNPINLGNPKEITILTLAEKIIKLTNSKSEIVFMPLPQDDPPRRLPDISKAKEILGWEPKINFDDALLKLIDFFRRKLDNVE